MLTATDKFWSRDRASKGIPVNIPEQGQLDCGAGRDQIYIQFHRYSGLPVRLLKLCLEEGRERGFVDSENLVKR
jgi:hypothetical protein